MNVLFVHSHKFRMINGKIYSPGGLSEYILGRYVRWFDGITVLARILREDTVKQNYGAIENKKAIIKDTSNLKEMVKQSDAVIVRLPSPAGYKAVHYAKKYNKPYLVEVVGCIWDAYWNYSPKGKLVAAPAMLIMKHSVKHAPYTIYVSQEFLQKRYPTNGKNVGISDVSLAKMDEALLEKRLQKIENHTGKIIIGTTAAVNVPYKGQEFMIRALQILEKKHPGAFEYHLVGGGDQDRLKAIAKECGVENQVKFLGIMSHEKVFDWLDTIDFYIQPSLQEGLCRALVEAMSRGLPCAASRTGGNPELLSPDYIFSMSPRDKIPERISQVLEKALDKQIMAEQAGKNFRHAMDNFEVDMLEARRDEFYLDFAEEVKKCLK